MGNDVLQTCDFVVVRDSRIQLLGTTNARRWVVAFTVLELLVVVTIIGLLASLVLPALTRAQAKAHGVSCLNNLKQLQMGWQIYVDDHGGKVPENYADLSTGVWRSSSNSWAGPSSAPFDPDDSAIRRGSLFRLGRHNRSGT